MAKEDFILRETIHLPLVTTGQEITFPQYDNNPITTYEELVSLSNSSGIEVYSAAVKYHKDFKKYATLSGQTWKMIHSTPQINVTPGTDPLVWSEVYPSDAITERDVFFAEAELSASDILNATKIDIIAAPPSEYAIVVTSSEIKYTHSVIYDTFTPVEVVTDSLTSAQSQVSGSLITGGASSFQKMTLLYSQNNIVAGKKLQIFARNASTVGSGTAKIYVTYKYIKL
ncbi:MAG: hypothetical protein HRT69_13860 [Flavobacteriaceae bacterium]|nr:hypothetical protein [Flavobacteriaceae bacterium]